MKKVFISLINFNNESSTFDCLTSLEKINKENFSLQTVIVDNASISPLDLKEKMFSTLRPVVLFNKQNTGFTGGQNTAIQYALDREADYILVLNNDTFVDKNLIENLLDTSNKYPDAGIVSPKIYFAKGYEFHKTRYAGKDYGKVFWYAGGIMDWDNVYGKHRGVDEVDKGQYESIEKTDFATGCCALIKAEVFKNIGLFDSRYFLYYEDADFSERVKQAGYYIYYTPKAIVWHKNASSAGGSGSDLQDYFISRNRLLFGMQYAPLRSRIALLKESILLLKKGRLMQKRGVIDFYLRKFGKGSYSI